VIALDLEYLSKMLVRIFGLEAENIKKNGIVNRTVITNRVID
jgi:hypothetical protein